MQGGRRGGCRVGVIDVGEGERGWEVVAVAWVEEVPGRGWGPEVCGIVLVGGGGEGGVCERAEVGG